MDPKGLLKIIVYGVSIFSGCKSIIEATQENLNMYLDPVFVDCDDLLDCRRVAEAE